MSISVRNYKHSKISSKLKLNAFKGMLEDIISCLLPKGYKYTDIILYFRTETDNDTIAECMYLGKSDENNKKQYIVTCNPTLSDIMTIKSIAHEFVHVKQYHKDELKDLGLTEHVWQGKKKSITEPIDYWFAPWEVEARGMEDAIVEHLLTKTKSKSMKGLFNYYAKGSARGKDRR